MGTPNTYFHFSFFQYHPNGQAFCTASEDKTARLFDIRSDQEVTKYAGQNCSFTCCGLSISGRILLCSADDNNVYMWDVLKGTHNGNFLVIFCH